jgi:hypothetical protein
MVNRGHRDHARLNTELFELLDRFRDKATTHLILARREKGGERQDV